MKDRTWNKIIFVIMAIVLGYFAISIAKADETDDVVAELELVIAGCAAANGITGHLLDNQYYTQESARWKDYLVGFTNYNEGRAYELIKEMVALGEENLIAGNATVTDFQSVADNECIKVRDGLLEITDSTIDDWFGE